MNMRRVEDCSVPTGDEKKGDHHELHRIAITTRGTSLVSNQPRQEVVSLFISGSAVFNFGAHIDISGRQIPPSRTRGFPT